MSSSADSEGLSAAQQALRRKFPQLEADDPILEMAAWNATLEAQLTQFGGRIDVWTTALLNQAEASSRQGQLLIALHTTLHEIAQNNRHLTSILQQLSPRIDSLQQDWHAQRHLIATQAKTFNHLSQEMAQLSAESQRLSDLNKRVIEGISTSNDREWRQWVMAILAVSFVGLVILGGFSYLQMQQAHHFNGMLNSALIRLERIERAFGIQP